VIKTNTRKMLIVFSLLVPIMLGLQLLATRSTATSIQVTVDIKPETLNLNERQGLITVFIYNLPQPYTVNDINQTTVRIGNLNLERAWGQIEEDKLILKFDASTVIDYVWSQIYHMGAFRTVITLKVTGKMMDGASFEGSDTITALTPKTNL